MIDDVTEKTDSGRRGDSRIFGGCKEGGGEGLHEFYWNYLFILFFFIFFLGCVEERVRLGNTGLIKE